MSCIRFQYCLIFILHRINKFVCKGLLKISQGLSHFEFNFLRYDGLVPGIHRRGEDLAFFSTSSFFPTTFVYIFSENAVHIGGFYFMQLQFMRLTTYERRMPDSLCLPLICCRMQGKRTDYCKVRIEVLNLFPGEK